MKNKNLGLKLGLLVFAIFGFGLSFSSAVNFNLNVEGIKALSNDAIKENMMNIHFADNGNDFGGFFYFSNGSGEKVDGNYEVGTSNKFNLVCGKQIRGFYYNAERGERLWPLDDQTWQNISGIKGLNTTGGIYTMCGRPGYVDALEKCKIGVYSGSSGYEYNHCVSLVKNDYPSDGFGYYGQLNQTYSGQEFKLTIGVDYTIPQDTGFISIKSGSDLKPTFVRINNKYPVGFVYDYNGGVGLAGCKFESVTSGSMRDLMSVAKDNLLSVFIPTNTGITYSGTQQITCTGVISTEDTLLNVLVEGIVGLDNHGTGTKFGSLGNTTDTKMQYFGTKTASNVALMNYAAKKAESLCRGKWEILDRLPSYKEKIVCRQNTSNNRDVLDIRDKSQYDGKTLIVKNADVIIKPDLNKKYDIFIDGGDLLIDESHAEKYVIGTDGFVGDTDDQIGGQAFNIYAFIKERGFASGYHDIQQCMACSDEEECLGEQNCIECEGYLDPACDAFDFNSSEGLNSTDLLNVLGNYAAHNDKNLSSMASVIKGNFIVNGKVKGLDMVHNSLAEGESPDIKLKHKYFIYGKFTTKSSISELENVFSWRCNNGFGTDNIFCPSFEGNPYRNAAVVVIDQNYGSPLLGS